MEPRGADEGARPPPLIDGLAEGRETDGDGERNVEGLEGERDENDGLDTDGARGAEGALER